MKVIKVFHAKLKRKMPKRKYGKEKKKEFLIFSFYLTPASFSYFDSLILFYIDSGAPIPNVSREFARTILAQSTRASLAALTLSSSAAITGTKR